MDDVSTSDEALVAEVAGGSQRALRLLMDRHMARAIRLADRMSGNTSHGDEIGQEAFVRVWHHARRFDPGRARFSTWLYQIVVNLALDRRRRRQHAPLEYAQHVASAEESGEDRLLRNERDQLAAAALATLPERQRAAIALFYYEGLSGREGAAVLDVSEKSFESLLSRGRAACRQFVAEQARKNGEDK
ncbi:RNA polymerase sigma factor [Devosia sp. FKR38]|uniref:RNA polymerase sigma factor n=1 Tax=Devosia sp. FKR38 TaxID=2562312 RepID=UPI0010BFE8FE|nr:RNA polymerase sigma factor [Devosia sp. FKR38]